MNKTFHAQFDYFGNWRRGFALQLRQLADWLRDGDLLDSAIEQRLARLEDQVRDDKIMVAFVAEFSRGKSELINAIFFADYGRRIMPAAAGRTTMCPTEISYNPAQPPRLSLLPIETRMQALALQEWRSQPQHWTHVDLDLANPDAMAAAIEKVAQVRLVPEELAKSLGFWDDENADDNPPKDDKGLVEVPMWRHAVINIPHPLLKQGLVILDTPGLNAIGAEPELTVSLIPQAHAAIFILGADTGVTRSDLAIWREHLVAEADAVEARMVVLNKIDMLWDALSSSEQVDMQIARQCESSAHILGLPQQQVIALSAQKGLLAKITQDQNLLVASGLPHFEQLLADNVMGRRREILRAAIGAGLNGLKVQAQSALDARRRNLAEQSLELNGLRGKSAAVLRHMRARITQEQAEFEASEPRVQALRSVHLRLMREIFDLLGTRTLKAELQALNLSLQRPGIKLGVRAAYGDTFAKLIGGMNRAHDLSTEIHAMLESSYRTLNAEYGFSLQVPQAPDMERFKRDLEIVQRSHLRYLSLGNALRLAQPEFTDRLVRALGSRLRMIYETALSELELWNKTASAQLDGQLQERGRHFARRIETIDRVQQATSSLEHRLAEIESQDGKLAALAARLAGLTRQMMPELAAMGTAGVDVATVQHAQAQTA